MAVRGWRTYFLVMGDGLEGVGIRVLLVEDYDDARQLYAEFLRHHGYEVIEAIDGVEAVRLARERLPDLVVLDIAIPRLDGFGVLRAIRADPTTASMLVLTLSASIGSQYPSAALASGATRALGKPCLPDELLEAIEGLLKARRTVAE